MNKPNLLLVVFCTISSIAFAQQDTTTIYQMPRGYFNDPIRSKWKKKIEQQDSLWLVLLYDKKNVLQEKISFEDKRLETRKGPYFLNEDGNLKEKGNYNRGYKVGEWLSYYSNSQLKEKSNYRWDLLSGKFISYWQNGQLKKEGEYINGVRIKNWNMFYENGKPALKENYDEKGRLINATYFDVEGKETKTSTIYEEPSYPGGLKSFFNFFFGQFKSTKEEGIAATYGDVKIEFRVNKDGAVDDINIIGSTDLNLSNELIRVMKLCGKWIPAKELGDPISLKHMISIKFSAN